MSTATTLPAPRSNLAVILKDLIEKNEISEVEYRQNGFRSRISDLKRLGIPVRDKYKKGRNQYGHPVLFKVRYLFSISVPKARRIYFKINSSN